MVRIPNTTLDVSALCLGTGGVGTDIGPAESFRMLDEFVALGGNFIDTAHNYGDWVPEAPRHASERTIGAWLRERQCRDRVVLATKGAHWHLDAPDVPRLGRRDIEDDLNGSLDALQTDVVDLYWLHRDDPRRPVGDILETLNDQVSAGKIRYFGASNWKTERLREAQEWAAAHGLRGFAADQVLWNAAVLAKPPYRDPTTGWMDDARHAYHRGTGMAVMPYQSQAYGLFQRLHAGTLDQMNPGFRGFYKPEETQRRYERMRRVMDETGLKITQVSLGYLTSQPFVTVPILGCRNTEQLRDSMSALGVRLTSEQTQSIQNAAADGFEYAGKE